MGDDHYKSLLKVPEGFALLSRGDFSGGIATCKEFINGGHIKNELSWLANGLVVLGMGASAAGRTEEAMTYWTQLLELSESHKEQWRKSYALWGLGIEAWRQGDLRRARALERESIALRHSLFTDDFGMALCCETLAWIAASENQNHEAARLLGVAQMLRQEAKSSLFTFFRHIHERCQSQVRRALGDKVYQRDFDEGRKPTFEPAIVTILQKDTSSVASEPLAQLTRREREVADYVARGISNKQIAKELVLSPRTVESHIDHILTKLGFSSRHQITAWFIEQGSESKTADDHLASNAGR